MTATSRREDTPSREEPRGHGETILLVDDEKALRTLCGLFLKGFGYNVVCAATPEEALQVFSRNPDTINLLLTDVVMPGMDGRLLAKKVGAVKPDVKVMFMSGYMSDVSSEHGLPEKNTSFIAKPFKRSELARKVTDLLEADATR